MCVCVCVSVCLCVCLCLSVSVCCFHHNNFSNDPTFNATHVYLILYTHITIHVYIVI